MSNFLYTKMGKVILDGGLDLSSGADTIEVMLLGAHTADPDDEFVADLVADELSVTGYTGGYGGASRKVLASQDTVEDLTNDLVLFDGTDIIWESLSGGATVEHVIIYKNITSDALSPLLAHIDTVVPPFPASTGGNFTVSWNSINGIFVMLGATG